MMSNFNKIPALDTPHMLGMLIEQCETKCVSQCCGLDAFNFSPLNIAFFFTAHDGKPECITKEDIRHVKRELKTLRKNSEEYPEIEYGYIGFLKAIKRPITRQELNTMCEEIEHNVVVARELIFDMRRKRFKK